MKWFVLIGLIGLASCIAAQRTTLHFKDGLQIINGPGMRTLDPLTVHKDRRYIIMQFSGVPTAFQRHVFEQQGVRFLHYIPDQAYYVSMPSDLDVSFISTSIPVQGILSLQPQHKISETLTQNENENERRRIQVLFVKDIDNNSIEGILKASGIQSAEIPLSGFPLVEIDADDEEIAALSAHPTIVWLDLPPAPEEALRYRAVKNERVEALYAPGIDLSGDGITIGVGDAGKVGDHIDLNSHVTNYSPYSVHFHATHVSGIIAGRPNLNPFRGQGIAPGANIVTAFFSQIISDAERFMTDYHMLITNNSYGSSQGSCTLSGDYNLSAIYIDEQLVEYDSLMHVFSAGNDGGLTCSPYPQRFHTIINGWQCAKNTLVVGMLDHVDVIHNASSRGPVDDGRIKPEIMAVGTNRWSTQPSNTYNVGSGTSYSGPAIAGISALLYQAFQQQHGQSPDAALIKALLLNTADDLGQPGPDFSYGYGRVNAMRAYDALIAEAWFSGQADQDDEIDFMLDVPAGIAELRLMLLWKDPSAAPYSAPALVNDLGLIVTDPSATDYQPWVLNPSPTGCTLAATRSLDDKNPQEQVTIANPAAGIYTLKVDGSEVPFGPQSFYLVYELVPHNLKVVYPNGSEFLVPGETEWIRWDAYGSAIQNYNVQYSTNNGTDWTTINSNVTSSLRRLSWVVPSTTTDQLRIRVTAGAFQDVSDTTALILRVPTGYTLTTPCRGYAQMTWTVVSGADHYAIYQLIDGWMEQIDTTSSTSYLIGDLDPVVKEWVSVASVHDSGKQSRRATAKSILASGALQCTWMDDVLIEDLIEPLDGRQFTSRALSASDTIVVSVRNAGSNSVSNVPISYRINNGTIQTDTITGPLSAGTTTSYTFQTSVNLSAIGAYVIETWTSLAGDTHTGNDTLVRTIRQVANDAVTLPWSEGFEAADEISITTDQYAVPILEFCDFDFNGGTGRIRTHAGGEFIAEGNRAITLDAMAYGTTSLNFLDLTINLSAYDTTDDVRLTFSWMHHVFVPEGDTENKVWVRGSDLVPWIELLDFNDIGVIRGELTEITSGLQITNALKENNQNFSSSFQLRFRQQGDASADNTEMEDGYTIDNLHLFTVTNDLRIVALDHPQRLSCGLEIESIAVAIENTSNTTMSNVDVSFHVENGDTITEQIASIPAGDTVVYHFIKTYDFTEDTSYSVSVWVHHPLDSYAQNDSLLMVTVHNSNSIAAFPYLEDFEQGDGGWYAEGINSSLEFGTPAGSFISKATSGTHAWVTNLEGDYNDDEVSYLISPCFDLTSLTNPVLSFSHIFETETGYDFNWVEYSTDGQTWDTLGSRSTGFNWYNNTSDTLLQCWEGTSGSWHVASIALPADEPRLQIRFVFTSDVSVTYDGFGIDDVHIHERVPVYYGPDLISASFAVNGNDWVYLNTGGQRVLGIHPMGQDLGSTTIDAYQSNPDDTADDQAWLLDRNWTVDPMNDPSSPVKVRLYFTEADFDAMLLEADQIGVGCIDCIDIDDAYEMEGWKYSGTNEDSTLLNNTSGISTYFPDDVVQVVPYDSGYYAEFLVLSLSELWLTGPRIKYVDSTWFKVSAGNDDAEEYTLTGSVNPVSPVLDIAEIPDSQVVAVRFRNVEIPQSSYIENAWLQFSSSSDDTDEALMTIRAEDPYSATSYTTRHFNITSRIYTTHRQTWNMDPWNEDETGDAQHSPDLRMLVQEIVDNSSWLPGRDVAFTLTGNGTRRAWSIDGDATLAPMLFIEYDSICSRQGVLYVDGDATGFATGESWTNALTDLQHALDVAMRCTDAREIWVKEGTYKPAPFNSFDIASGIKIYGGFNGTETLLTQRDPVANPTILSGDLGVIGNSADNSNHVVHILAGTDTTIVDGFTITDGNAQTTVNKGGGIFSEGHCMLRNVIITNCQSIGGGSAIAHRGSGKVMLISNSLLQNNTGIDLLSEMGAVMKVDEGSVIVE
ncbi:MAG TPA: S8 family serine peptidase [Saprospiraceae bacterium]|nr:S8 family serine peptidase [Saprospiraceae bacterium]